MCEWIYRLQWMDPCFMNKCPTMGGGGGSSVRIFRCPKCSRVCATRIRLSSHQQAWKNEPSTFLKSSFVRNQPSKWNALAHAVYILTCSLVRGNNRHSCYCHLVATSQNAKYQDSYVRTTFSHLIFKTRQTPQLNPRGCIMAAWMVGNIAFLEYTSI